MLQQLTTKQEEFLTAWANVEYGDVQMWLGYRNKPVWRPQATETTVAKLLDITNQAGIALLSGLVRNGWMESTGEPGEVVWALTEEAIENIEFFLYEPVKSPWES